MTSKTELAQQAADTTIASYASKATIGGGATTAVLGSLSANELAVLGGLIVAALGLIVQMLAQSHAAHVRAKTAKLDEELRRADESRKQKEHALRTELVQLRLDAAKGKAPAQPVEFDLPDRNDIRQAFQNSDIFGLDDFT